MMKNTKKTYIAPAAELILLAPLEALAATGLSDGDKIALNKWGYWAEDGKIYPK